MTSEDYMITMPEYTEPGIDEINGCHYPKSHLKRLIKSFLFKHDIHKWVIGYEVGKNGYKHFQGRFRIGDGTTFEQIHKELRFAHIERSSDDYGYECKSGNYRASWDKNEVLKVRFGKPRKWQVALERILRNQTDREIHILTDVQGNCGKTWLTVHMYEKKKAFYVPPTIDTVKGLIQFVCSGYKDQPYIFIDIPRSWKWTEQLYTTIETIKDGLVYDTRYNATLKNIRGVKILVMSNTTPKLDKLSVDRWRNFTFSNRSGPKKYLVEVTRDGTIIPMSTPEL